MNINIVQKKLWMTLAVGAVIAGGCQNVIKVDLNNAAPQTVIEGSLSNLADTVKIALSQTTDYFNPQNIKAINDAQVSISDDKGNVYRPFTRINGVYIFGRLSGIPGKTYTLNVVTNTSSYSATSTMPGLVPIDSLAILPSDDGDKENVLNCYIQDPAGIKNYYRMRIFLNDKLLVQDTVFKREAIILFSDKYFDGRYTPLRVPSRRAGIDYFLPGDNIKVQLMSIDSYMYYFLRELRDITSTGRFISSTSTPDNPDNNITNNGLGYFSAWAISEKTLVVK